MAAMPPSPESLIAHGDFLRGLARNLLDEHRAEDMVQQTYVRALSAPPRQGLRSWLATVVKRLSLNERRAESRRVDREGATARTGLVPSTEEIVQREALRQQVVQAVLGLAEPYRSAVVLRHFESLSPAEIGERLGVSGSTVRSRLQRAHQMLRTSLDEAHGDRRWAILLVPIARQLPAPGPLSPLSILLMKKTVLSVVAAASLVAVAWFSYDILSAPTGPGPVGNAEGASPLSQTVASEATVEPAQRQVLEGPGQLTVDEKPPAMSPSYVAALAGFRGRVVDRSGIPSAGSGVEMFRLSFDAMLGEGSGGEVAPRLRAGQTTTGSDGVFVMDGIRPSGLFLLRAGVGTDSPTTRVVQYSPSPGQTVDIGDVVLETMGSITGVAVDQQGDPVSDAEVLALDLPPAFLAVTPVFALDTEGALLLRDGQGPVPVIELPAWVAELVEALPIPRTRTDSEGRFVVVGVPGGLTTLAVVGAELQPLLRPGVRVAEGERTDLGTLSLEEGEQLSGMVVDSEGEPIPDAEVLAAPNNPLAPFDFAGKPLTTDGQGRFTAAGFPRGRVKIAARRSGDHRWVVTDPRDIDAEIEIELPAVHTLTLRMTSNDGLPISSPQCTFHAGHGAGLPEMAAFGLSRSIRVDERVELEGELLRVHGLEPGWYTLRISDPAHAVAVLEVELGEDTEVEVLLDAQVPLVVHAVDSTNKPVAGATIFAIPAPTPQWPATMPIPCGVTDASGMIALDHIAGEVVDVIASHPAFGQTRSQAYRSQSQNTITFAEIGAIEGVIHESGRAVDPSRWSVFLQSPDAGGLVSFPRVIRPDLQGRFRFPALQPGPHRVQALDSVDMLLTPNTALELGKYSWMPGSQLADVDVVGGRVEEIRLDVADASADQPGARITGSMLIDGRPGTGIMVVAELVEVQDPKMVQVDGEGRFDLGHIIAGTRFIYMFDIVQRSFADNQPHLMWSGYVEVSPGDDRELAINVQTGSLAGEVLDADGQPAAEVWVEARGVLTTEGHSERGPTRTRYVVQTDSDGRFEIQGVPPGTWRVGSRATGAGTMTGGDTDIVVEPGQRRGDVRIRMQP